ARFPILCASWSLDGKWLACAGRDAGIQLWERDTKKIYRLEGHAQPNIHALAWSPDRTTLGSAGQDGTVRCWKPPAGQGDMHLKVRLPVTALAWSPTGDGLITATINGVQFWDAASWQAKDSLSGAKGIIFSLAWSSGGIVGGGTAGVLTWR